MRLRIALIPLILLQLAALVGGLALSTAPAGVIKRQDKTADPLPSWNDDRAKQRIVEFVDRVTKEGGPDFVPVAERIATFDNDGTLWCEKPMYVEVVFAIDRVKALADKHPEWATMEPFASAIKNDMKGVLACGEKGLVDMLMATHTGMTPEEFEKIVAEWLATARHPRFKRPYTELVYQPMLELLAYLRAKGFKTFIVSGGEIDFMRPFTTRVYGIPPEQVVGSSIKTKFEILEGKPIILRIPAVDFIDDKAGKPVGIQRFIGRRPIMAFGNSDGDLEMLQWTTAGRGARFGLIVHHTDAEREYAYDRESDVGRLDKALDAAAKEHWLVVDMKKDWKVIFSFEK
jgi:haloacid dehalogenase-like hydrolase